MGSLWRFTGNFVLYPHFILLEDRSLTYYVELRRSTNPFTNGKEVNGTFSDLSIEEIDRDMYDIDEYDGKETVVTIEDICWTVIKQ